MPHLKGDVALYYQFGGGQADGAETVVFVNGLTMDTTAWAAVEAGFADSYRTLRYDCRGQGESDKPPGPYTLAQHAADLIALLDGLGIARCHLVGLSNGGLIAMTVAGALGRARIESLVTIAAFARVDAMLHTIVRSWKAALQAGGPRLRFEVATPWVWGHSFIARHQTELAALADKAAAADPQAVGHLLEGLLAMPDARKQLRAYDGPVLAVVGQEDLLTPLRYSHEIVEWARHGVLVTLDQAGHAAPIEQPEAVVRVVRGFIERRVAFMTPLWSEEAGDDG